jgi:hypothetical protein
VKISKIPTQAIESSKIKSGKWVAEKQQDIIELDNESSGVIYYRYIVYRPSSLRLIDIGQYNIDYYRLDLAGR